MVKLLKKFTATMLAFAIVMSSATFVFANTVTSQEKLDKLVELEAIKGDSHGVNEDDTMTRYRSIVMMLRLKGLEDEMLSYDYAGKSTFTDAKSHTGYMQRLLAYIKNNPDLGVDGYPDGSFKPLEPITAQEHAKMMLEVLGYEQGVDFAWNEVTAKALEVGLIPNLEAIEDNLNFTILNLASMTYDALSNNKKGKEMNLGEETGFIIEVTVPKELEVVTVKALNNIQVQVTYNMDVAENDAATDLANYTLEDTKGDEVVGIGNNDIEVAAVDADGKVVTLTLDDAVEQQQEAVVIVDEEVLGSEFTSETFEFFDTTLPEALNAEVVGKDTVKVTFSEPINFEATNNIANSKYEKEFSLKIGTKTYNVDEIEVLKNGTTANVSVYGSFVEGTLTLKVENGLRDYAGFSVMVKSFDIEVVKDTKAPEVVGYKDATRDEVTLIFNEDIQLESSDEEDFYHTNSKNHVDDIATDVVVNGNELTLKFSEADNNQLPEGTAYVYVAAEAVSDLWDNVNDQQLKTQVEVELDQTAPTVKKVELSNDKMVITFSEALDSTSAQKVDNYTISDADGDMDNIRRAQLGNDAKGNPVVVTVTFRDALEDGEFTVEVENVKDTAGNKMADYAEAFTMDDETKPEFPATATLRVLDANDDEYEIIAEYREKMKVDGNYSITDLNKYELFNSSDVSQGTLADLDKKADISVDIDAIDNNESVSISIDGFVDLDDTYYLKIGRVADAAGNLTAGFVSGQIALINAADKTIGFSKVEATDKETIKIKFNGNIDDLEIDDFALYAGTVTDDGSVGGSTAADSIADEAQATAPSATWADTYRQVEFSNLEIVDGDEIILTLGSDDAMEADATNGTTAYVLVAVGNQSQNKFDVNLQLGAFKGVADKIKADVVKVDDEYVVTAVADDKGNADKTDDVSTITFTFDEAIQDAFVTEATFEVNNGDNAVTSVVIVGNAVTLTVKGLIYENDTVELVGTIYDNSVAGTTANKTVGLVMDVQAVTEGTIE